jgi:hypothetical protein
MIKQHDRIVLTETLPAQGLEVGDVGTVVHVYADRKAFEVEFMRSTTRPPRLRLWTQSRFGLSPVARSGILAS